MESKPRIAQLALAFGMALALAAGPALAEKDRDGHGKGHAKGHAKGHKQKHDKHFNHEKRVQVLSYYDEEFRGGHCPPGLAKKHNGCMPPGQAKKWRMNQPLAKSVVIYELPPPLVVRIGAPPPGYRYVRCDSDILLISVSTRVVVDVIANLGRA